MWESLTRALREFDGRLDWCANGVELYLSVVEVSASPVIGCVEKKVAPQIQISIKFPVKRFRSNSHFRSNRDRKANSVTEIRDEPKA